MILIQYIILCNVLSFNYIPKYYYELKKNVIVQMCLGVSFHWRVKVIFVDGHGLEGLSPVLDKPLVRPTYYHIITILFSVSIGLCLLNFFQKTKSSDPIL